jgi:hypothetical protein
MTEKKILAISFYGSTKHQLIPYKSIEFVDVVEFETNKNNAGVPGSIEDFEKLDIDYRKYYAVITWGDSLFPVIEYFFKKCLSHNITIYGNQHGVNKSILQIIFSAPNKYCKYWLTEGAFMIDRFKEVTKSNAIENRWYCVGSPHHEFIYKNFKWSLNNTNSKVLIIHEPNLFIAENDKRCHNSEEIIDSMIEVLNDLNIEIDLKVHPNWKGDTGNSGKSLKKFNCNYVDISFDEIVKYSLVVGSRSSLLYESYLMNIPVLAIKSKSDWPDDKISFLDCGVVDSYELVDFKKAINMHFNKSKEINIEKVKYLSGDIDNNLNNYLTFIREDSQNKLGKLSMSTYKRFTRALKSSKEKNKYIELIKHKLLLMYPRLYKIIISI